MIADKFTLLITAIGLTVGTASLHAQGEIEAVNVGVIQGGVYSQGIVSYVNDETVGWTFSPSENILVSSLGWLGGTNASSGVNVGLWAEDGTLLRSTTLDNNDQIINGSGYEAISPIFLPANETFVVAASIPGQTFTFVGFLNSPTANSIAYINTAYSSENDGFTFPTTTSNDEGFIPAATFLFQSVPEPSVLDLSALGSFLLAWRCWKRRDFESKK